MPEREQLDRVLEQLSSRKASIRCQDMSRLLASLGFEVRDGKKAGHKVFVHHGIATFTSGAYTCGHGRNPEIISVYVDRVISLLKQYEIQLIQYLRESS